ncbi:transcription factor HES-2-like [Mastacembelus armatus]|uniref:Transcription factor HES-2-like n=1 Tax=Mastacembelus armatus TaxID=205130 RepID=A0A7N9AQF0_9TELE|nr:transcription factor HES-2-like [Mastacembelus armatus]
MKVLQEKEDTTRDRKFIKSQVEKRRRERMNRSLEHLRALLLPEPQQLGESQHRVEKAEILEHAVLFLQNSAKGDLGKAGDGGGQQHSFQDGFSTCLQRAAQFLGPEGKGLWLGAALCAAFAARFACSDSDSASVQRRTETCSSSRSLRHTKTILRMLKQKSKRDFRVDRFVHPYQVPAQQGFPSVPQQPQRQNQLDIRMERQASKQSPSQSHLDSQTLWRPWP